MFLTFTPEEWAKLGETLGVLLRRGSCTTKQTLDESDLDYLDSLDERRREVA